MDSTTLLEALARSGVSREALVDGVNRGTTYFAGQAPSPEEVDTWIADTLKTLAPHLWPTTPAQTPLAPPDIEKRFGMSQALWDSLSAAERLARARALQPPAPKRRPQSLQLSPQQVAALAALEPTSRLTEYRRLQQAAQEPRP